MRTVAFLLVFAVIGLAVGYGIFGKIAGHYVSVNSLLSFGGNALQNAWGAVSGLTEMRNKILLCGAGGAVVGFLLASRLKK
ncbi:MAG: hypothetical protein KKF58_01690 [Gammaproteobacteria bacterium]|nr:hypothetical protein [Gammaproteobacteria bacterium]MBU1447000.1 hypothetical protein [Gammaproteobacteria bacterium]MDD2929831.1 hypothetical protein [Sideroxydans sp.]MDD5471565.1 hypothetical protein [Sideroxydans sp.]